MKRRLFIDSDTPPTETLLRKQLGKAMSFYTDILQTSGDFRKQWQYSRGNGWILRVDDMRNALYYLIAFEEGIEISLTVRDKERADFLGDASLHAVRSQLKSGTKYPQGYALRFEIENPADCSSVSRFLAELIRLRATKAPPLTKPPSRRGTARKS